VCAFVCVCVDNFLPRLAGFRARLSSYQSKYFSSFYPLIFLSSTLSLTLSLSFSHSLFHFLKHSHTLSHTTTHLHILFLSLSLSFSLSFPLSFPLSFSQTLSLTSSHIHTHTSSHTQTHTHILTHTNTHFLKNRIAKDFRGRFHQLFSRAFFVRLIQNVTRKKTFVQKTRAKNVGEIDSWSLSFKAIVALLRNKSSIFRLELFCLNALKNF